MTDRNPRISEDEARDLWKRALELQNTAERRTAQPQALVAGESSGLSLEQVAAAAEGAGIDPEYVRFTLAERQLADADRIDPRLWTARWLRALLREPDAIEEARFIAAAPSVVVAALKNVSARPDFELIHESSLGDDAARDGVLVYRLPNKGESFHRDFNFADARVLMFSIRPDGDGTRVRLRIPLFRRGINLALLGGTAGGGGWGGMAIGSGMAGVLAGVIGAGAIAALPLAAGAGGAWLGMRAYRALYRSFVRGGYGSAARLLQAIAIEAESIAGANLGSQVPSL